MTNSNDPIPPLGVLVPRSQRVLGFLEVADKKLVDLKQGLLVNKELVERREQELYLEVIDSGLAPAKNAESRKALLSKVLWADKPYRAMTGDLQDRMALVADAEVRLRALEREWRWLLVMLEIQGARQVAQEVMAIQQVGLAGTVAKLLPPVKRFVSWADPLPPRIPQVDTEIPDSQKGRPHDAC